MYDYIKIEFKRAFNNVYFYIAFAVAIGICIWHFIENAWPLRRYIYEGYYPLSAFTKWIGGDNASLQPTLYYLIIPILCAIPYGRSFYLDVKSGFIVQMITRGEKKLYIASKFICSFVMGAVTSTVPLLFDFILTNMVLPAVIPQRGTGLFPIVDNMIMSELFYTHPYIYVALYLLMDALFFGLFNMIALWAVSFVNNGFWIVLMPFLSYMFIFSILQFINEERYAPMFFLRPSQPFQSEIGIVVIEFIVLILLNVFFFIWYRNREQINYE